MRSRKGGRRGEKGRGRAGRKARREKGRKEQEGRKKEAKLSKFVKIICKKVKFVFKSVHIFGHVIEDREVSKSCSSGRSNTD